MMESRREKARTAGSRRASVVISLLPANILLTAGGQPIKTAGGDFVVHA